jgi:hypothetical protein
MGMTRNDSAATTHPPATLFLETPPNDVAVSEPSAPASLYDQNYVSLSGNASQGIYQ